MCWNLGILKFNPYINYTKKQWHTSNTSLLWLQWVFFNYYFNIFSGPFIIWNSFIKFFLSKEFIPPYIMQNIVFKIHWAPYLRHNSSLTPQTHLHMSPYKKWSWLHMAHLHGIACDKWKYVMKLECFDFFKLNFFGLFLNNKQIFTHQVIIINALNSSLC